MNQQTIDLLQALVNYRKFPDGGNSEILAQAVVYYFQNTSTEQIETGLQLDAFSKAIDRMIAAAQLVGELYVRS